MCIYRFLHHASQHWSNVLLVSNLFRLQNTSLSLSFLRYLLRQSTIHPHQPSQLFGRHCPDYSLINKCGTHLPTPHPNQRLHPPSTTRARLLTIQVLEPEDDHPNALVLEQVVLSSPRSMPTGIHMRMIKSKSKNHSDIFVLAEYLSIEKSPLCANTRLNSL